MRGGVAAGTACCAPTELIWAAQTIWKRNKVLHVHSARFNFGAGYIRQCEAVYQRAQHAVPLRN
jgi:hypothetical protein